jgi:DNA-binding transcriptional ArsR family regulator
VSKIIDKQNLCSIQQLYCKGLCNFQNHLPRAEIPEEIRRAIRGLDSKYRAAIFIALYKHGELSFSELTEKLGIGKAELYYHLKELTKSALVEHYYKHELGAEQYSFYSVTQFGQNFIEALSGTLRPEPLHARAPFGRDSSTTFVNFLREKRITDIFMDSSMFEKAISHFEYALSISSARIDSRSQLQDLGNQLRREYDLIQRIAGLARVDANKSDVVPLIEERPVERRVVAVQAGGI